MVGGRLALGRRSVAANIAAWLLAGCATAESLHEERGGGGADGVGGASSEGGLTASGGVPGSGGLSAQGGAPTAGGTVSTGGVVGTGGTSSTGGAKSTGGVASTGGAASGGVTTGGASSGGSAGKGGSLATGGAQSSGGASATGGAGKGGAPATGGAATTGGMTGAAGAGSSLFSDDFENGAAKWAQSPVGSDWAIASDGTSVFKQSTLTGKQLMAAASAGPFTDQVVEARVKVLQFSGQSTGYYAAICARFKDADNFFYLALSSDGKLSIRQKFNANNTRLSNPVDSGVVVNTWYTLRLSAVGNTLTAFVDGVQKATFTVSSNPIASGGIGLATYNAIVEFDDVRVTAP